MGEYAKYKGDEIKIATCEEMFILPSVAAECTPLPNSFDPRDPDVLLRVRFPLPERVTSGLLTEVNAPSIVAGLDKEKHLNLSRGFDGGAQVSIPCELVRNPGKLENGILIHRNGGVHGYKVTGFAIRKGMRALIVECVDCGAKWSLLEDPEDLAGYKQAKSAIYDTMGVLEEEFQILERMVHRQRPSNLVPFPTPAKS